MQFKSVTTKFRHTPKEGEVFRKQARKASLPVAAWIRATLVASEAVPVNSTKTAATPEKPIAIGARKMTLKQCVSGMARFQYFRDGELWYKTDSGFLFPVPALDALSGTFQNTDKAILFMRWIRKFRDTISTK